MKLYDESFQPSLRLEHITARLIEEKRYGDAIVCALAAVHFRPDHIEPYTVLAAAYDQIRGCEEFQIAAAKTGLALRPDKRDPYDNKMRADLYHNMALAQNRRYEWNAAIESTNKAHHLNPQNPWHLGHAAQLADEMGDSKMARTLVWGAINLIESEGNPYNDGRPVSKKFHREMYLARSISSLKLGDFPAYFKDFETRLHLSEGSNELCPKLYALGKLWRPGQPIGERVLIVLEQGLGDQIEFARLVSRFKRANPQITRICAACSPAVVDVVRSMPWFDEVLPVSQNFDPPGETIIGSLDLVRWSFEQATSVGCRELRGGRPDIFGEWEGVYVRIPGKAAIRREVRKTAVGFCWQGNPLHVYDWARSVPIETFVKWAESKRDVCTFHSIQHGANNLPDWIEDCDRPDYAQLGEVINACDAIVGPDTGMMHLAGAMGKSAVMLHTVCRDWRWTLPYKVYGDNFLHLVQAKPGDWNELLSRLGPELDRLMHSVYTTELAQAMAR